MNIALAGADYYPGNGISVGALIIKIENPNAIYVWTQQTSWTAGVWYYFTIVEYSTNPTSDKIFINGISNTASTLGSPSSADLSFSGSWGIGGGQVDTATISSGYSWFQGALDEFQILGGVQSNYGINTSYNNQLSSKSFFSVGTEQSLYPTVKNFGVFYNGTGHPQFWTNVTIGCTQRSITSATISLNGTAYSMALNGSGLWVFSPALVHFNDYYTYQIISATDSFGNSLFTPTNTQNVRFNLDKVTPTVLTWTYDPTIGINGTFIASVADTWGIINTVIVTVTY